MLGASLYRLSHAVFVLALVSIISFVMFRFAGDPCYAILPIDHTPLQYADCRARLFLDDPFLVQYGAYLERLSRGDLGVSLHYGEPVLGLIFQRFPATFELVMLSGILSVLIGIPLGVLTAVRPTSRWSGLSLSGSLLGASLPTFLIGILLMWIFAVELRWLPSFGRGETVMLGHWDTGLLSSSGWRSIILPVITLTLFQIAVILRLVRSAMLEILRSDFVRFANARGLRAGRVNYIHALPNALIPVVTIIGLQIGSVLSFAIVTEVVFQWPGMGLMFVNALQAVDLPLMAAYLLVCAVFFLVINLVVDLLYLVLDPRIAVERS